MIMFTLEILRQRVSTEKEQEKQTQSSKDGEIFLSGRPAVGAESVSLVDFKARNLFDDFVETVLTGPANGATPIAR